MGPTIVKKAHSLSASNRFIYIMAPVTVELEILKKQVWDHNSVGYELHLFSPFPKFHHWYCFYFASPGLIPSLKFLSISKNSGNFPDEQNSAKA